MSFTKSHFVLCVFAVFMAAPAAVRAADDTGFILDHKALYVARKIGIAHRFELKGGISEGEGQGTIVFDTNECTLNEFGDRTKCTEIANQPVKVKFQQLKSADPSGEGREVYRISGTGIPKSMSLTLVIGSKTKPQVLRLVVVASGKHTALSLVPTKEYDKSS